MRNDRLLRVVLVLGLIGFALGAARWVASFLPPHQDAARLVRKIVAVFSEIGVPLVFLVALCASLPLLRRLGGLYARPLLWIVAVLFGAEFLVRLYDIARFRLSLHGLDMPPFAWELWGSDWRAGLSIMRMVGILVLGWFMWRIGREQKLRRASSVWLASAGAWLMVFAIRESPRVVNVLNATTGGSAFRSPEWVQRVEHWASIERVALAESWAWRVAAVMLAWSCLELLCVERVLFGGIGGLACPSCGYDLQGQREGGCPECGWERSSTIGASAGAGRGNG